MYYDGLNYPAFENTSHVCNFIQFEYDDQFDNLMQFSFYITIEHESQNLSYITAVYNNTMFIMTTYQSTIHYIHRPYLPVRSRNKLIFDALTLQDDRIGLLTSIYYISISSAHDCKQTSSYRFLIVGLQKKFRWAKRVNLLMLTYLKFQGSYAYYKSMYHRLTIDTSGSPSCDLMVNFQLVFTRKTNKTQDKCKIGYRQVSKQM